MSDHVDALSPAGVSELASFIIRPPRAHYSRLDLGDVSFSVDRHRATRHDITLVNPRGHALKCSHFRPNAAPASAPTLVYLHGNGSCRVEATTLFHLTIPYGISLFAFDFSGSGRSEGEFISLGVWEKLDVETVVDHLVSLRVASIVLWGHSMGAATALMYAGLCKRRPQVKALVLDSPFASFEKLAQAMVSEMQLPAAIPRRLVLSVGVRAVRKNVRERAGFDVYHIDPLSAAKKIDYHLPAMFIHGTADVVVPISHGQLLYDVYPGGEKQWVPLQDMEHDSARPEKSLDMAHVFLQRVLLARPNVMPSVRLLHVLKERGNFAMLTGRLKDSIYLYTEALNALSQGVLQVPFADAVGEYEHVDQQPPSTPDDDRLVRRVSSISNLVTTTVRLWRFSKSDDAQPPPPVSSSSTHHSRIAAEERALHAHRGNGRAMIQRHSNTTQATERSSQMSVDAEERLFSRQRSWRGRTLVHSVRKCLRSSSPDYMDEGSHAAESMDFAADNGSRMGLSRRSSRSGRSSRSSSRARLRPSAKKGPRERGKSADMRRNAGEKGGGRKSERFGMLFFRKKQSESGPDRPYLKQIRMSAWDLDNDRKAMALALLCNRSLARRRSGDVKGALFDAVISLQLDPAWIRGYVRKAAALKQDGQLRLAKEVVVQGLSVSPQHQALNEMLVDLDNAEKDLVKERKESNMLANGSPLTNEGGPRPIPNGLQSST